MNKRPWYQCGLRFECTGCGKCCGGAPGYVWVTKGEIAAMAARLEITVFEFEARYVRAVGIRKSLVEKPGGDCVFLDSQTKRCGVYDARPLQCRTWPFWHSNTSSPEAWQQTSDDCPGCNNGRLYSPAEIEERVGARHV